MMVENFYFMNIINRIFETKKIALYVKTFVLFIKELIKLTKS